MFNGIQLFKPIIIRFIQFQKKLYKKNPRMLNEPIKEKKWFSFLPRRQAEGRPELHAARAPRPEGQLYELALALRVDAPEAALAGLLLAARHFYEVSETYMSE